MCHKLIGALLGGALLCYAQSQVFTTFAGQGQVTTGVGPSVTLKLSNLKAIAADPNDATGSVLFADGNRIFRSLSDGSTTLFAGGGSIAATSTVSRQRLEANFGQVVSAIAFGGSDIFVATIVTVNNATIHQIYRIRNDQVLLVAGGGDVDSIGNTPGPSFRIPAPVSSMAAANGDLFFLPSATNRVLQLSGSDQRIRAFAGNGNIGFNGDDHIAQATTLTQPTSIATDGTSLFVAENSGCRLRRISLNGTTVSTAAGNGTCQDGPGQLNNPFSVAVRGATIMIFCSGGQLLQLSGSTLTRLNPTPMQLRPGESAPDGTPIANSPVFAFEGLAIGTNGRTYAASSNFIRAITAETVAINVRNANVAFPAEIDGVQRASGSVQVIPGTQHVIRVPLFVPVSASQRNRFLSFSAAPTLTTDALEPKATVVAPFGGQIVSASYLEQFLLSVTVSPAGSGRVRAGALASGASISGFFDRTSTVTMTAFPNEGFSFLAFTGSSNITTNPGSVVVNGPLSFVANILPTAGFAPIRFNVGGQQFTDDLSQVWSADPTTAGTVTTTENISGTTTPALYQTARRGLTLTVPATGAQAEVPITYTFNVPNGSYNLRLKFADFQSTAAGQRRFTIKANGATLLANFDIFAEAGGRSKALDKLFSVQPSNGVITVTLEKGAAGEPLLNAIQLVRDVVGVTVSPAHRTLLAGEKVEFASTVAGSENREVTWTIEPEIGAITADGVYTAPSAIEARQRVTVTAASKADPTRIARAFLLLSPPWSTGEVDGLRFQYQPLRGDGDILARVVDPQAGLHGVTIRESLEAGAPHGTAFLRDAIVAESRFRTVAGAAERSSTNGSGITWIHMRRVGERLTTWFSLDGVTFDVGETVTVPMKEDVLIGMLGAGEFDDVTLSSPVGIQISHRTGSLAPGQRMQLSARVVGTADTGVTWSIVPEIGSITGGGLYTAPEDVDPGDPRTVRIIATSTADPSKQAFAHFTLGQFQPVRVNAGGVSVSDEEQGVFSTDLGFTGGLPRRAAPAIPGVLDVYQTERASREPFEYRFAVPEGGYVVKLRFIELTATAARQRVFHVELNGKRVLENFDVFAAAGGAGKPLDLQFEAAAAEGEVRVRFVPVTGEASVSAIEVLQ